ncbi:hypothetical protein BBJ28_00005081 [Nothophytophthora sp. Chile5]|nr:hypothetical protein BBJ28_00005081 [Nothophytophthora sp. Chile5]
MRGQGCRDREGLAKHEFAVAAMLLGVEEEALSKVVMERDIVILEVTYWCAVDVSLVHNLALLLYVGVLGTFGFEAFQNNGLEELLENCTNEVLLATFTKPMFIAEMEMYRREGITVGKIKCPNHHECAGLIAAKPDGIPTVLDAEARNPKHRDKKFPCTLRRQARKASILLAAARKGHEANVHRAPLCQCCELHQRLVH